MWYSFNNFKKEKKMNFPFRETDFNGNLNIAIAVNLVIYAVLLISVPSIVIGIISFIKPKIKAKTSFYLYAFSSAVFLMVGTVGLIREGYEGTETFTHELPNSEGINQLIMAGIIAGGALAGLTVVIVFRYFFVKFSGEVHKTHDNHSHDDHIFNLSDIDNPKAAWLVIFLILSHRTIDGFVLGGTVAKMSTGADLNLGLFITFILHIFVEVLIVYYRQVQYGQKRWKALFYNFVTLLAIVPVMVIGAYINQYLAQVAWILPFVNVSGGSIIAFVGVIELVPEFLHYKRMSSKDWYKLIICYSVGIVFALFILSFHTHEHVEEHAHDHDHETTTQVLKLIANPKQYLSSLNNFNIVNNFQPV
ncbi:hypothetical protein D8X55_00985 [Malacoplasma penetrans]|nr:hypothetical protein D8X55_00985 [Malacoplasma penetrans]